MSRVARLLRTLLGRGVESRPTRAVRSDPANDGEAPPVEPDQPQFRARVPAGRVAGGAAVPAPASFGHYRILAMLGAGGMGVVYKAQDTRLRRLVALKFLSTEAAGDQHALERFRREARAASALNHPNICTVYDIGESEHGTYIAMELLEGSSLREYLGRSPLSAAQVFKLATQLASALQSAHARGIVHRDIKPENLFIVSGDRLKVLDFGLAKLQPKREPHISADQLTRTADVLLTLPGVVVGTTAYMSPEQARAEEVDSRSDLFSFGAVLFEMVARRRAFVGKTSAEIHASLLTDRPTLPLSIEPPLRIGLQQIIDKALEKSPEFRYQHASEFGADLRRLERDLAAGRLPVVQPGAGAALPQGTPVRRHVVRDLTRAAAVAAVAFLAYGLFDGRASGRYLTQFQLALMQDTLQNRHLDDSDFEPGGRQLPLIVDVSALHPDKRQPTDRALLNELIDGLRSRGARAIGIDLRFDDIQPSDFQFFHKWVSHHNVWIGVYNRAVERREAWLGRPDFSPLAAGIALPPDNPQHAFAYSRRWFPAPPAGERAVAATEDCGAQHAAVPCKEDLIQLPVALWLFAEAQASGDGVGGNEQAEARLRNLLDARQPQLPERPSGNAVEFGTYVIDYSYLKALRQDVLGVPGGDEADRSSRLSSFFDANGSKIADRIVLVGDLEDTADQFCQTQAIKPLSGVLVHACSLATLNRGVLLQATAGATHSSVWLLSLGVVAVVVGLRICHASWPTLRQWPFQELEILVFTSIAFTVLLVCRSVARTSGIVWPNFLWFVGGLIVYPFAGPFARAFVAVPKAMRSMWEAPDQGVRGG